MTSVEIDLYSEIEETFVTICSRTVESRIGGKSIAYYNEQTLNPRIVFQTIIAGLLYYSISL